MLLLESYWGRLGTVVLLPYSADVETEAQSSSLELRVQVLLVQGS